MEQTGSKSEKEYVKAVYCHPAYLTYMQSSVQFSSVAQSCLTLSDPMDCSLPCSSAHGIFQARILEWVAISFSRRSSRPRSPALSDFIFWGSKITADGDCRHEIKGHLLFGRKLMTNLDSIFKSRDIALPAKVHLLKSMVFPVVVCGCESWTIKKAE